jgi:4-amino-4-deoxy-L-arabinose transferase-like glycosyltransferase
MNKIHLWILGTLFVLGLGLRLFRLGEAPAAAIIDEAHFGYIAYSLLETGKDEHGVSWPLLFTGFGDQKLPVYAYSLLPVIAQFGLNVFSIRVPSALAGSASILLIYVLARTLGFSRKVGVLAAAIMAISPWPFFLSRFGFESNVALLFFIVGLIFLVQGIQRAQDFARQRFGGKATIMLSAAAVLFGLTWYTYIAYRPVTLALGLLVVGFAWFKKQISLTQVGIFAVTLVLVTAPLLMPGVSAANTARFNQIGIVHDQGVALGVNEQRTFCAQYLPALVCYGLWNKPSVITAMLVQRFWNVYSPQYLALEGEVNDPYLGVGEFGQFYSLLYLFFLIGVGTVLVTLAKQPRKAPISHVLIVLGLILGPVPAILAGEAQKVRLSPALVFMVLGMAYGLAIAHNWLRKTFSPMVTYFIISGFVLSILFAATNFMVNFHTIHSVKNDYLYQSYAVNLWRYVEQHPDARVYLKPFFSDPLMSYAFYAQLDPATYQEQVVLGEKEASGFQHAVKLGRIEVGEQNILAIGCQALMDEAPALYVTNQEEPVGTLAQKLLSTNGVMTYGYIYDARLSALRNLEHCSLIAPERKQALLLEFAEILKDE